MRVVIQRAKGASVQIKEEVRGFDGIGLMVLVGIEPTDTTDDADWLAKKLIALRIFDDDEGVMNRCVTDVDGDVLIVSQFTLMASYKKGNRPSYIRAAQPDVAVPLYEYFVRQVESLLGKSVSTGEFGADMQVRLCNSGPVTICMDSKNKE
ncbi:MAG: D-tyrosyl-tRNA(Tyr) deacylase [Alloprevotella sp.]|nr:D-tyrosyl-tRNA(Tyr) deacylase [Alloprevotella sp.]